MCFLGNKPLNQIDKENFRSAMAVAASSVEKQAVDAFKARQGEIFANLNKSLANGFSVGVANAKSELTRGGKKYDEETTFDVMQTPAAREALNKANANLLKAEAHSIQSAMNSMMTSVYLLNSNRYPSSWTLFDALDQELLPQIENGLTGKTTKNGASLNISNYAEGLTRETSQQALLAGQSAVAKDAGFSLVRISEHQSSCPKCQPYQGRVLVDDVWAGGKPDGKHELLSVAIANGLFHWNCRHTKTIWYPGAYEPKAQAGYDPKKTAVNYQLEQQQRLMERTIRKYKRIADAALTPERKFQAELKVKEWQGHLRGFVKTAKEHGFEIYRQSWKEQVGAEKVPQLPNYSVLEKENSENTNDVVDFCVNFDIIESERYRNDISKITKNPKVAESIYSSARDMLKHRSGTNYEDDYAIGLRSGKIIAQETSLNIEGKVGFSALDVEKIRNANEEILTLHNHPHGRPPTAEDVNALFRRGENNTLGCCLGHNSSIYLFTRPEREIVTRDYVLAIQKFKNRGFSEDTAQLNAIEQMSRTFGFDIYVIRRG